MGSEDEEGRLRSAALQNASAILLARKRAEEDLLRAKEALELKTVELVEETRVLELLNRTGAALASELDLKSVVQTVTDAATELSGARFGAFFYNVVDEHGESFMLYTLSGAPREAFEKFGHPRATALFGPTFRGEGVIRIADVLEDPRYGKWGPHHGMPPDHLPVRSYLAVPVRSRSGEVIGGLFFGHPTPGVFTERSERLVVGVAAQAAIAMDNARLYAAARESADAERAARTEVERASAMKDDFLATLSHELRTPLGAILGWSQMLRMPTIRETDLGKGLEAIERNARVQTQLIEDLLDMSRITAGKLRLDVQLLDPVRIVEASLETLKPAADVKGIRVDKVLDTEAGRVAGDPTRLQQVLSNLLSNAVKFTPKGGRIQVVLRRVDSQIEISVSDTGIGISPDFLPHVFDRFRQADPSATRAHGGLGIGLSIVQRLTELHGGTVRARSEGENKGSTFSIVLPAAAVQSNGPAGAGFPADANDGPMPGFEHIDLAGVSVVAVDDDADTREVIERVLSECGAAVRVTGDPAEAIDLVRTVRPDVFVSDIGMPVMDGYELLREVRKLGRGQGGWVPAVALTAMARSDDRTRALRAGFLLHLAKPMDPGELVATVAAAADRAGPRKAE